MFTFLWEPSDPVQLPVSQTCSLPSRGHSLPIGQPPLCSPAPTESPVHDSEPLSCSNPLGLETALFWAGPHLSAGSESGERQEVASGWCRPARTAENHRSLETLSRWPCPPPTLRPQAHSLDHSWPGPHPCLRITKLPAAVCSSPGHTSSQQPQWGPHPLPSTPSPSASPLRSLFLLHPSPPDVHVSLDFTRGQFSSLD